MKTIMLKELLTKSLTRLTKRFLGKNGYVHQTIMAVITFGVGTALVIALLIILVTNFEYEIEGDAKEKPIMVFDDGIHTVIKYDKLPEEEPKILVTKDSEGDFNGLFVGDKYYKVKYNSYIFNGVADEFEIVGSDEKIIKISRGKSYVERVIDKIEEKIYS